MSSNFFWVKSKFSFLFLLLCYFYPIIKYFLSFYNFHRLKTISFSNFEVESLLPLKEILGKSEFVFLINKINFTLNRILSNKIPWSKELFECESSVNFIYLFLCAWQSNFLVVFIFPIFEKLSLQIWINFWWNLKINLFEILLLNIGLLKFWKCFLNWRFIFKWCEIIH